MTRHRRRLHARRARFVVGRYDDDGTSGGVCLGAVQALTFGRSLGSVHACIVGVCRVEMVDTRLLLLPMSTNGAAISGVVGNSVHWLEAKVLQVLWLDSVSMTTFVASAYLEFCLRVRV